MASWPLSRLWRRRSTGRLEIRIKESGREVYLGLTLAGEFGDAGSVFPGHPGALPLIDTIGGNAARCGDCSGAAELINQVRMAHEVEIVRGFLGLSTVLSTENVSDDFCIGCRDNLGMPRNQDSGGRNGFFKACGRRFGQLRRALDFATIRALADELDEPEDNIGNWERGQHLVPPDFLRRLYEATDVAGADFVYLNVTTSLPVSVSRALRKHEKSVGQLRSATDA